MLDLDLKLQCTHAWPIASLITHSNDASYARSSHHHYGAVVDEVLTLEGSASIARRTVLQQWWGSGINTQHSSPYSN